MYYESRIYETRQCPTIQDVANIIKTGDRRSFDAFTVNLGKKQLIVVDDSNADYPFLEVAVLLYDEGQVLQIESITAGWVKTSAELAKYFEDAIKNPAYKNSVNLNLGHANEGAVAWFDCGCCGEGFKGNVAYQLKFDQDNGYGICKKCEQYYL